MEDGQRALHHFELALHHDQVHGSLHHILIGAFKRALMHLGLGGHHGLGIGGCNVAVGAFGRQLCGGIEGKQAHAAHRAAGGRNHAVGAHRHLAWRQRDGLQILRQHRLAGLRDQLARLRAVKAAVARVADAVFGLYGKEARPLKRQIQRIAGLLHRPLRQAQPVAAQQPVVVHRLAQLRVVGIRPQQHGAKVLALGAVAVGLRISQVGRGCVKRLAARHQSRHGCVIAAVHGVDGMQKRGQRGGRIVGKNSGMKDSGPEALVHASGPP